MATKKLEAKSALKDADQFLKMAKAGEKENLINRVVASAYSHALMRANDALVWYFLGEYISDHGNASKKFRELYEQNHIDEEYSRYTSNISDVLSYKNDVEYKAEDLSNRQFSKIKKQTTRFIENVVHNIFELEEPDLLR